MAIAIPLLLLPALAWGKFLQRIINYRGPGTLDLPAHAHQLSAKATEASAQLALGQRFLCGTIDACSRSSHLVEVGKEHLTFWSVYPLQKLQLRQDQQISVVYQTIPSIPTWKFALAYRTTSSTGVRGVAAREHAIAMLLMVACSLWFEFGSQRVPLLALACVGFAALNGIYLGLMLNAKAALHAITTGR